MTTDTHSAASTEDAGGATALDDTPELATGDRRDTPSPQGTRAARRTRRAVRRGTTLAALAMAAIGGMLFTGAPAFANQSVSIAGSAVSVRDCYHPSKQPYPSTSCTYQATLEAGLGVRLVCQYAGQSISGDVYWDYVLYPATGSHGAGEGYVSDWYVNTGVPNPPYRDYNVPICAY